MAKSAIRFSSFPRTAPPPEFASRVVDVFRSNEEHISTVRYKYRSKGREMHSTDYANTVAVADAVFGHTRVQIPYGLTVIGY